MISGIVNYELWKKCNRPNGRLHHALQLMYNLTDEEQKLALAHHLYRCAELKLYDNTGKIAYQYLLEYEKDMIKSIMAGDTVEDFIRENVNRKIN